MLQVERPLKTFDVLSRKDREPPQYFIGRKFGSFFPKNRGLFFALITVQYQRIRSRTWKILSLFRVHHNPALLLAWWRGLFFGRRPMQARCATIAAPRSALPRASRVASRSSSPTPQIAAQGT